MHHSAYFVGEATTYSHNTKNEKPEINIESLVQFMAYGKGMKVKHFKKINSGMVKNLTQMYCLLKGWPGGIDPVPFKLAGDVMLASSS